MAGHEPDEYKGVAAFFNYLSSPEVQARWHQDTGYLPITTAAYELTKEQGFYEENPGTDVAIVQMTGKAPTANSKGIRLGNFDQIRAIIDEELEAVWAGDKEAKAALDDAVSRGNELLRRFERSAQQEERAGGGRRKGSRFPPDRCSWRSEFSSTIDCCPICWWRRSSSSRPSFFCGRRARRSTSPF
jgi:hypothetical protein